MHCRCTCRLVHGFTCAGVLPTQYIHFTRFAGIGSIGHAYIRQGMAHASNMLFLANKSGLIFSVYNRHGYIGIVGDLAERSMQGAVEQVKALPDYPKDGEVINLLLSSQSTS